jgi:hypothetical protein
VLIDDASFSLNGTIFDIAAHVLYFWSLTTMHHDNNVVLPSLLDVVAYNVGLWQYFVSLNNFNSVFISFFENHFYFLIIV